jgi:hypothetical protein
MTLFSKILFVSLICIIILILFGLRSLKNKKASQISLSHQMTAHQRRVQLAELLLAELIENKNKCEAFIAIYADLLQQLRVMDQPAAYQETGDFVHRFVPLNRYSYDTCADDLPLLGDVLENELKQLYTRISPESIYDELHPNTSRIEALRHVEVMIDDAQQIGQSLDQAIQALSIICRTK